MNDITFKNGEKLLQEWRPQFRIFLRKLYALAGGTGLLLAGVSYAYAEPLWMLALPLFVAAFMFDDFREWRQRRHDRWLLTNQRLIFINPDEDTEPMAIDLQQISRIRKWMWWALSLKMTNGQSFTMMLLPQLDNIQAAIQTAADQTSGGDHG
ncbi:MAG: hypothetical protein ACI92Z_003494 [Paracoccaceae bacterium]|jgi:hypothetical protein